MIMDIVLVVVLVVAVCTTLAMWLRLRKEHRQRVEDAIYYESSKDKALIGQKSSISGNIAQKFCPFMPEYPYNLNDVVPVFNTCDFMVFVGKTNGVITEVVFQEMKLGGSGLSISQRQLRECIKQRNVRWETWQFQDGDNKWGIANKEVNHEYTADSMPELWQGSDGPFAGLK